MSSYHKRRNTSGESNADKLRDLLNGSASELNQSAVDYLKSKYSFGNDGIPALDDLVRLIQTIENVNQQLLFENKFLKDEATKTKTDVLRVIEENVVLHKELKNCTVLEILTELQASPDTLVATTENNKDLVTQIRTKEDELQKSQLLINELQRKLLHENTRQGTGAFKSNTLDSMDISPICCTKCVEETEIKIRQIENLKNDNESLFKTKEFLRSKLDEFEVKEADMIGQIKKYADVVEHVEKERDRAFIERDQYAEEKANSDRKIEEFLREFQENLLREKSQIVQNVNVEIERLGESVKELEVKGFKQESLIDRLTREKIGLVSELESFKTKCNSIDLDTHQMAEKLRHKYQEVLKERDIALYEVKRLRHDYDSYVKDTDQSLFCLRNELSTTRSRLLETENDTEIAADQCIELTETVDRLKAELVELGAAKKKLESSKRENVNGVVVRCEERESKLAAGVEALQARYCLTVKELEDLIEMQKKLLRKLKNECKVLNEQLEILAIKYKNDVNYLNNSNEESAVRIEKYKARLDELEEQSVKHNDLHDKMKARLKDMTLKIEQQNQVITSVKSNESLMRTTNIQLIQEIDSLKKQLGFLSAPMKLGKAAPTPAAFSQASKNLSVPFLTMMPLASSRTNGPLESARSAIEESIFSIRSKIAV